MEYMDPALVAAPLPSLSPLSGTIRPGTAASLLKTTWNQMQKQRSGVKRTGGGLLTGSLGTGQLTGLAAAAKQHVSSIHKTAGAPYSRASTPQEKARAEEDVVKQLQALHTLIKKASQHADSTQDQEPTYRYAQEGNPRPLTPANMSSALKELLPSRPSTSMSVQDMTLPRPASRASRFRNLPTAASWSGPLPTSDADCNPCGTPTGAPRTPNRLRSRGGLRASAPSLMAALTSQEQPQTWVNPMAQQPSPLDEQRALLRSSMGNRAVADATGSMSSATAAANARQKLLELRATAAPTLDTLDMSHRPRTPGLSQEPSPTASSPGLGLLRPGQSLQQFVPTRGMLYSVFSELDPGDTGKITYSTFEQACVLCGLHEESSRKIFHMLDPDNKGFFTIKDWGDQQHEKQTMEFTRLYIHTTRGATGKPAGYHEMKSAMVAVQVALHRLKIKNNGKVVSKERLMEAFEFMDTDGSASLSMTELENGFNAMGIYVTPDVLNEIMDKFDANKDGSIGYREFIGALYPVLSKGL